MCYIPTLPLSQQLVVMATDQLAHSQGWSHMGTLFIGVSKVLVKKGWLCGES